MISRLCFAALMITLSFWLYWLSYRQQQLFEMAEALLRGQGATLPPPPFQRLWVFLAGARAWFTTATTPVMAEVEPDNSNATISDADSVRITAEPPVTEPTPVVRPSPVPRDPGPDTTPMERAWDESAAELPAVVEQDDWQAEQDAKWEKLRAEMDELARGTA